MKHDAIRRLLGAYLDGEVKPWEKATVEEHLATCSQCRDELAELTKTIYLIKNLDEVESPAWLTPKIMRKVSAEAAQKRGILGKLFYPLRFKLPVETAAVVFLAVTAFYIYQSTRTLTTRVEAPRQETTPKNAIPKKKADNRGLEKQDTVTGKTEAPPSLTARDESSARNSRNGLEKGSTYSKLASEPLRSGSGLASGNGTVPLPPIGNEREKLSLRSPEVNRITSGADGDSTVETKQKKYTPVMKTTPLDERGEKSIRITLNVKDSAVARNEIEKEIRNFAGKIIKNEFAGNMIVLVAEIDSHQLTSLLEKVRALGEVKEKVIPEDSQKGTREIHLEIIGLQGEK